jgi:hypothetical protein
MVVTFAEDRCVDDYVLQKDSIKPVGIAAGWVPRHLFSSTGRDDAQDRVRWTDLWNVPITRHLPPSEQAFSKSWPDTLRSIVQK